MKAKQAMAAFRSDSGKENAAAIERTNGPGENNTAGTETGGEAWYSIEQDMSDDERYEELNDKTIEARTSVDMSAYSKKLNELEELKDTAASKASGIIVPIAEKIGILNRSMRTPDIDVEFEFSKNGGLRESIHQQMNYGGNYADFAKALLNIDQILETAVLIEQHGDKYQGTKRENVNLESVSVLFGLFKDGKYYIPTQFEIKMYKDVGTKGKLYMTVAMTKIEAGVLERTTSSSQSLSLIPTSTMHSIADVFSNINTLDKNFLKYMWVCQ